MDKSKERDLSKGGSAEISRRSFLKGAGLASIGAAVATGTGLISEAQADTSSGPGANLVAADGVICGLEVNGKKLKVKVEPRMTLAEVLRDYLHLTGTKVVCDRGACGACTVIVDGISVLACMTLALDAVGKSIETIEGLETDGKLHPLQQAFVQNDALQCGFCTPGMVMSCKNLLDRNPNPTLEQTKTAVRGNLCRCGTYPKVFAAVMELSGKKGD